MNWRRMTRLAGLGIRHGILQSIVLTSILALVGCGPSFNKVSGTVTYRGKKLTTGTITFYSADGKTKNYTSIDSNGYYEQIEPPLGKVRVGIAVKPPPKMPTVKDKEKEGPKITVDKAPATKIEPVLIPPDYADPGKSGLNVELKSGSNTYDIELVEKAPPPEDTKKKGKKT